MTDIQSAEPRALPCASTTERHADRRARRGDGVVRLPGDLYPARDTFVYAVAEGVDTYGVWMSWNESELPDTAGHLYTDRPIYRPGETVYFRGAVRDRHDMTYSVPSAKQVHVSIDVNWGGQMLLRRLAD